MEGAHGVGFSDCWFCETNHFREEACTTSHDRVFPWSGLPIHQAGLAFNRGPAMAVD
jgi:hypothetical protein